MICSRDASDYRALPLAVLLLTYLLLAATQTFAGAWPREKGRGFLSSASQVEAEGLDGPYSLYSTAYLEYGLGHDLTLGFDVGHAVSGKSKAVLFLRRPLGELAPGHLFAAEFGIGRIAGEAVVRPGLSYGHGFTRRNGQSGWISIESFAEFHLVSGTVDYKADFTYGLNHGQRFKSILQLQTGVSHGDPAFARLAPSVVMRVGRATHIELGLTAEKITGDERFGVKFGFWREF